jgi:hypothetical protein
VFSFTENENFFWGGGEGRMDLLDLGEGSVAGFGGKGKEPYSDFFEGDGFLEGHIVFHKNVQGTYARRYDACFLVQNVVTSLEW